jgi:cytochrome c5
MSRRSMNSTIFVILMLCLIGVISSCSSPTPTPAPKPTATEPSRTTPLPPPTPTSAAPLDGETLLRARCTGCHTLERVTMAKKSRDQWAQTSTRMVPSLTQVEQPVLFDYLAKNYGP